MRAKTEKLFSLFVSSLSSVVVSHSRCQVAAVMVMIIIVEVN